MNDLEFHEHFRLDRNVFRRLVGLKNDPVFLSKGSKPFRGGVTLHMLVLLKLLGIYGIGKYGTSSAIPQLEKVTMPWPDDDRRMIALRMQEKHGFVNCIGIMDGTLFPLAEEPRHHGESYYSRKSSYSVNVLVTCDDVARIHNLVVGWP
ncbi:hypothetical protein PHMEG_00020212 [Phytophthora megakarya]|uniref:DDE Tnp4 domain-containing protein n=1 Tax=Phytophthora megakarya TaxID=4795 RepID=A0A225VPP5_9STRA|nr:hypothetical protein PHMEG_00020212 [Phytophthora megakarya]